MNGTASLPSAQSSEGTFLFETSVPIPKQTLTGRARFPLARTPGAALADLVRAASSDDLPPVQRHQAFEEIVQRFQDFAFGLALGVLGDRSLAEDAAQESFVTAWQHLGSLREPNAFPGWFGQIVRSRCHRVTRSRRVTVSYETLGEMAPQDRGGSGNDPRTDPVKSAERRERQAVVWEALCLLPPHQRTAAILYYLSDMDQGAIANFLGVPVTTVKKRVWAARKSLRERMQEYMDDAVTSGSVIEEAVQSGAPSRGSDFQNAVAFWTACEDGDAERLTILLTRQPEGATLGDGNGTTLLHRAAECGHTDVVRLLIARGAKADARDRTQQTTLHCLAAGSCRAEIAELLIDAGAPVKAVDADRQTALDLAARGAVPASEASGDNFALAEVLLSRGAALNLQTAVALDKPESIAGLARDDKDGLQRQNADGDTPLHIACRAGYRRVAKALLDAHTPIDLPNADGHTPREVALQPGRISRLPAQTAIVRLLDEKGAAVSLRAAAMTGDVKTIKAQLAADPKANAETDAHGATALHFAAWMGRAEAVSVLLAAGANPAARDHVGRGALSMRWLARDVDFRVAEILEHAGVEPDFDVAMALGRTDTAEALLAAAPQLATPEKVRWAIDTGCPPPSLELLLRYGVTLTVHEAAALGDVKRLTALLERDPTAARHRDRTRETPLHQAARRGHQDAARLLLNAGASPDAQARNGATPLYEAVAGGHLDLAEWLLEQGAKANLATHRGDNPLHAACAIGYTVLVNRLLTQRADANAPGAGQDTPLHRAAERGHLEIVALLLKQGANVNARNYWNGTALHVAAREGHEKVLRSLLAHGAELLARDRWDRTALHVAAYFDQADAAQTLLEAGTAVTELSYGFSTPLHTAADRGSITVARLLVAQGADVNASTDFGRTPLHDAVQRGQTEMVGFLLQSGADPKRANNRGMTPLHWAAAGGHLEIADLLIRAGAETEAKSERSETPRDLAERHGRDMIVALLS